MNRRNFIRNILIAGASFTILPGAGRIWKAERSIPNPAYTNIPHTYNSIFIVLPERFNILYEYRERQQPYLIWRRILQNKSFSLTPPASKS